MSSNIYICFLSQGNISPQRGQLQPSTDNTLHQLVLHVETASTSLFPHRTKMTEFCYRFGKSELTTVLYCSWHTFFSGSISTYLPIVAASSGSNVSSVNRSRRLIGMKEKEELALVTAGQPQEPGACKL